MTAADEQVSAMNAAAGNPAARADSAAYIGKAVMWQAKFGSGLIYLDADAARQRLFMDGAISSHF
jgi:hypothetical protein